ncbi:MAG: hemolysin family protein [Bacteroidales bacterium]|nr:hemolysin family protein [Bacteroidales bacterium]
MILLFVYLIVALSISFLCSILEAVLLSATSSYLETFDVSNRGAMYLKKFKTNNDRPISSILSLNTIAHTVGAAGVGAQATEVFGEAYFGVVSAILTLLILVFSEIIPKSIGSNYWRKLISFSGWTIHFMIYLCFPLVIIFEYITKFFSRKSTQTVSREEIAALTHIGEREGIFAAQESEIINNLIHLKDIKVKDIMTPRTVAFVASENMTVNELYQHKEYRPFSRILIYHNDPDNITGYIMKTTVLEEVSENKDSIPIYQLKRDIFVYYENFSVLSLFETLIAKKEQIAMIVDEYGTFSGIVTMEDIIETLIGFEIVDEHDKEIDMQQFAKENWEKRSEELDVERSEKKSESEAE